MTGTALTESSTVSRSKRVAQRLFEGRMLVITVDDSKLHRFNEVGTFIWQLLGAPLSVEEMGRRVAGHFEGCSQEQAQNDVIAFVEALVQKGLVTVSKTKNQAD